jgi:hypothetical protein
MNNGNQHLDILLFIRSINAILNEASKQTNWTLPNQIPLPVCTVADKD